MSELVHIEGTPRPQPRPRELWRIAFNLAFVCALAGVVLGGVFLLTTRIAEAGRITRERAALDDLLGLAPGAPLLVVDQALDVGRDEIVYRAGAWGAEAGHRREQVYGLDGTPRGPGAGDGRVRKLTPLGRLFVAGSPGSPSGFVLEGSSRGYKNRIRFFVALDADFSLRAVRVLEHEEDPGLGAEVATPAFLAQYESRDSAGIARLEVTRDPLPEDWRAALADRSHMEAGAWRARHAALIGRQATQAVHAVTGATISSRALTDGVRVSVEHFRRRWALMRPWLEGTS